MLDPAYIRRRFVPELHAHAVIARGDAHRATNKWNIEWHLKREAIYLHAAGRWSDTADRLDAAAPPPSRGASGAAVGHTARRAVA